MSPKLVLNYFWPLNNQHGKVNQKEDKDLWTGAKNLSFGMQKKKSKKYPPLKTSMKWDAKKVRNISSLDS